MPVAARSSTIESSSMNVISMRARRAASASRPSANSSDLRFIRSMTTARRLPSRGGAAAVVAPGMRMSRATDLAVGGAVRAPADAAHALQGPSRVSAAAGAPPVAEAAPAGATQRRRRRGALAR